MTTEAIQAAIATETGGQTGTDQEVGKAEIGTGNAAAAGAAVAAAGAAAAAAVAAAAAEAAAGAAVAAGAAADSSGRAPLPHRVVRWVMTGMNLKGCNPHL